MAIEPVASALGAEVIAAGDVIEGDIPLDWGGEQVGALRPPDLNGALDRMIAAIAIELGKPLPDLSREEKQRMVRLLDERGAFRLRKAVEDVADALGVSRFTVYNYLGSST